MRAKLNPFNDAKISFPGFQRILDFTSAGGESSKSVAVDGDADKEYIILIYNSDDANGLVVRLNNDSGSNYGYQYLFNNSGTLSAARGATSSLGQSYGGSDGMGIYNVLTPTGLVKSAFCTWQYDVSGSAINRVMFWGATWNNTAKVTSLDFVQSGGTMVSGTRIIVYARRSNP